MPQSPHHIVSKWYAPIEKWAIWQFDPIAQELPHIDFVDSSLRRKLSLLTKMSLKVAHDCAADMANISTVYASRHGDLGRTTKMLRDLATSEILSPTAFSLSVLNASMGVYSITKKDTAPSIAVSAAESSFGMGLLEAHLQLLSKPDTPVLFVYAEDSPPDLYAVDNSELFTPHAIALLLTSAASLRIMCELSNTKSPSSMTPQSLMFMECLTQHTSVNWSANGKLWNWQYCGH